MSNIKSDIINNITVTMSVYIQDREVLDVLELVLANELMKVNVEEITTLPAEVKSSVDQRNAYLVQLFMIQKRHLKKRTIEAYMGSASVRRSSAVCIRTRCVRHWEWISSSMVLISELSKRS